MTLFIKREETKPEGLFQYFKENEYSMSNPYKGIYYIEGNVLFPTQIIVTKELNRETHIWLKALSEKLGKKDIRKLLDGISQLTERMDREWRLWNRSYSCVIRKMLKKD